MALRVLLLAGFAHVSIGVLFVSDHDTSKNEDGKLEDGKLYHPGYPPLHVTRLGRLHLDSQDGTASLIQAERQWGKLPPNKTFRALANQTRFFTQGDPFVWMPKTYVKALRQSHKYHYTQHMMSRGLGVELGPANVSSREGHDYINMGVMLEEGVKQARGPSFVPPRLEDLSISRSSLAATAGVHVNAKNPVVMPLNLLRSEYMGPIGVGTVKPPECQKRRPAAFAEESDKALMDGVVEDEDQVRLGPLEESTSDAWSGSGSIEARIADEITQLVNGISRTLKGGTLFQELQAINTSAPDDHYGASLLTTEQCQGRQETFLSVVYDTGSTNIWISSDLCVEGGCVAPGRRRFNHSASSTFSFPDDTTDLTVEFGTGTLSGPLGTDSLRIGPVSIRQTFAMMEEQSGWIWQDVPIEGIVGLGFPSLANTDKHPPFFDSVIKQQVLDHNEFAFYISRENPAANAIMWGGVDENFFTGPIEFFPVVDAHYWAIELQDFKVGNTHYPMSNGHTVLLEMDSRPLRSRPRPNNVVVLDTGTSVLGFAGHIMDKLVSLLPEAPCDKASEYPTMTLTLRNARGELREFSLTGPQYMSKDDDSANCMPAIMQLDLPPEHGPGIVLGDVFLREYFSVYDRGSGDPRDARVGLAPSRPTHEIAARLRDLTGTQQPLLHS